MTNYKKQIEEILEENKCKIAYFAGTACDFKTLAYYDIYDNTQRCNSILAKNYKEIYSKLCEKISKKEL